MKKNEYHAAEFARLVGVPKKTLLYYDEIGLFSPMRVEPNGYRVYSIFQIDRLALIIALRDLGVPLKEIRTYLTRSDPVQLDTMLTQQSEELARRMELLQQRREMLEAVRVQNLDFLRYCGKGPLLLARPAERLSVLMENDEREPGTIIVNYLTNGLNTGMCLCGERGFIYQRRKDGALALPAGKYVCLYEDVGKSEQNLQPWAIERRPVLESWAVQHDLMLGEPMYIETNEFTPGGDTEENAPLRTVRIPVQETDRAVLP